MTTTSFKFQCPHCAQRLACDSDSTGREIDCPGCERPLIIPEPPMIEARPKPEGGVAPSCAVRPRDWLSHIVLGVILGALAGSVVSLWRSPPMFLRGDELWQGGSNLALEWIHAICYRAALSGWGILGGILGGVWARQRFLKRLALAIPGVAPQEILAAELNFSAPSSVVLAAASLLLGILVWGWVLTRPPDAFHNEGGMLWGGIVMLFVVLRQVNW